MQAVHIAGPDGYWVSDDRSLINVQRVHEWLSGETYWAKGRPYAVTARAIEHSLVLGMYAADGDQSGFARLVTDRSTFAWLCDVFVAAGHRGRGLGTFLASAAIGHPDVADVRQVLKAEPGRSIYRRQGFDVLAEPERWMERRPIAAPTVAGTSVPAVDVDAGARGAPGCRRAGSTR
jgi:GNAT superfamily N-acetyltransferase